jgi:hypothetical protein
VCLCLPLAACDSGDEGEERERPAGAPTAERPRSVPEGVAGVDTVEESGKPAAKATEEELGEEVAPEQPAVLGARCNDGRCFVRYRSEPRGRGVVLERQSEILRRLFADGRVRAATLYVHHKSAGNPDKNEAPAFSTVTCVRSSHPGFPWRRIGAEDLARVCRTTHTAGGRQRSLIRRGELSNEEASRGEGGGP